VSWRRWTLCVWLWHGASQRYVHASGFGSGEVSIHLPHPSHHARNRHRHGSLPDPFSTV